MRNTYSAYLDPRPPESQRVAPRRLVSVPVLLSSSAQKAVPGELTNISRFGCRIEVHGQFAINQVMLITLPANLLVAGRVVWSKSYAVGLKLVDPLAIGVLDWLVERHPVVSVGKHAEPLASWRSSGRHRC